MSRTTESHAADGAAEKIKSTAQSAMGAAKEQYEHLRDSASEHFEQGREKALEWSQSIEEYVQEKPIKSLLIAAGVGVLLGVLWKRR